MTVNPLTPRLPRPGLYPGQAVHVNAHSAWLPATVICVAHTAVGISLATPTAGTLTRTVAPWVVQPAAGHRLAPVHQLRHGDEVVAADGSVHTLAGFPWQGRDGWSGPASTPKPTAPPKPTATTSSQLPGATACASIGGAQFHDVWRSVAAFLRVGDVLRLRWLADNTTDQVIAADLHRDDLHIEARRGRRLWTFLLDVTVRPQAARAVTAVHR
jgi:hypothetical protein